MLSKCARITVLAMALLLYGTAAPLWARSPLSDSAIDKRIRELRTTQVTLIVVDSDGEPLANTEPHPSCRSSYFLSKKEASKAQHAPRIPDNGILKADGVSGRGTRWSVEAFQKSQRLPGTGHLGTHTS